MAKEIKFKLPAIDKRDIAKGVVKAGLVVANSYAMAPGVALFKACGSKVATALAYVGSVSIASYVTTKETEVTDQLVDDIFDAIEEKKEAAHAAKYARVDISEDECEAEPAE